MYSALSKNDIEHSPSNFYLEIPHLVENNNSLPGYKKGCYYYIVEPSCYWLYLLPLIRNIICEKNSGGSYFLPRQRPLWIATDIW